MASTSDETVPAATSPLVIFRLLVDGAKEMRDTDYYGMVYGALFTLMGYAIAALYQHVWQLTMGLTAAFFLMGPFICCGIYDLSRQKALGTRARLWPTLTCWSRNWKSIAFFAAMLTFFLIVWLRVSVVLFALFATHNYPELKDMVQKIVSMDNLVFLGVWSAVGLVFASLVFAMSVVSVPMMLDRGADTIEAIATSAIVLWNNPGAMLVWALTIVVLIGASLIFFLPLLILTAPLVGHTTWKVYQALVPEKPLFAW